MSLVTNVKIENFKNIGSAQFKAGKFNQIVGANSQGKTAVNQAIEFVYQGSMNPDLIKLGEERALVELQFDDGAVMSRWLKRREGAKPTTAVKYERDGMTPAKVQAHINKMIGVGTFDPRDILNVKTRNQAIMEMIDVKVTKKELGEMLKPLELNAPDFDYNLNALQLIDKADAHFYSIRTERNRETKAAKVRYDDANALIPKTSETLRSELTMPAISLNELETEKQDLGDEFKGLKQKVTDWEIVEKAIQQDKQMQKERVESHQGMTDQMDALLIKMETVAEEIELRSKVIEKNENELGVKPDVLAETERITNAGTKIAQEIQRHETIASVENQEAAVKSLDDAYLSASTKSNNLDLAIGKLRGSFKQEAMSKADLPIKGLGYADGKFNLAGRSLDLLSSSEALIIGLQLTRKKNPHTNVICIDGGECLDAATYANLQKAVSDDGFNYFVTKVGGPFESETDTVIEMQKGEVMQ